MTERQSEFSRRQFLVYHSVIDTGATEEQAIETLASVAGEHPEWDLDEQMTWSQWDERQAEGSRTTALPQSS